MQSSQSGDYIREESSSSKCICGSNPKHHHMKWCIVEIVLVGDRDPGSKQWCTNSSEGARQVQGQGRSSGAQLPKSKASVRKEVDSEEHHSAIDADLSIVKEGIQMQGNVQYGYRLDNTTVPQRRDFCEVIDPLLSWRESIDHKRD
ncbi:hypothetical protein B296_00057051 [Ensete ventricosum]|uniref:Uncharacterized protein n=1 Tax=Ensete ventricosum TaxID=4639 RepID=A0A426XP32_ENSVE|nr:hypothetical protein B296_00057051 [Ensete ventricosum]